MPVFDKFVGDLVASNEEGSILTAVPFEYDIVKRYISTDCNQSRWRCARTIGYCGARRLRGWVVRVGLADAPAAAGHGRTAVLALGIFDGVGC
jgi:hypothetical protein